MNAVITRAETLNDVLAFQDESCITFTVYACHQYLTYARKSFAILRGVVILERRQVNSCARRSASFGVWVVDARIVVQVLVCSEFRRVAAPPHPTETTA